MSIDRPVRTELPRPRNYILSRMPEEQYRLIARQLVPVDLPAGLQLSSPHAPVEYIYFPISGLVSTDALTTGGESVQVSVTGREGITSIFSVLGSMQMAHSLTVQLAGSGHRMRLNALREEFVKGGPFADLIHCLLYAQFAQISQSVLCNRLHPVDKRLARWLLTASDRAQMTSFQVTQEALAQTLGSRRSTVNVAAGELQREGLIGYSRGTIRILNRAALRRRACECYQIVRNAYATLIGHDF